MIRLREMLSLTLPLVRARARTNTEYITMNYLRPDARFSNAELFLSFASKSARGDVLFCECADCKLQSTNCTAELVSYEPLYAVSPCEGSRLFVCISERFAAHTLL